MVEESRNQSSKDNGTDCSGVIGAGSVISAVDWKMVVSSAVVAGVVSLLTSVAGIPEVEADENLNNLFSDGTK